MAVAGRSTHTCAPNTREDEAGDTERKIPDYTITPYLSSHTKPREKPDTVSLELSLAAPLAEPSTVTETSVYRSHFRESETVGH